MKKKINEINKWFIEQAKICIISDNNYKILYYGVNCKKDEFHGGGYIFHKIEDALNHIKEKGDGFCLSAGFDGIYSYGGTSRGGCGFRSITMPTTKLFEILLNF